MYNGIGLNTPRGSGTNGYVQRNLSFSKVKTQLQPYQYDQETPKPARKPSTHVLLHQKRRQVEVECLEYETELRSQIREDDGSRVYTDEEITEKVARRRNLILENLEMSLVQNNKESLRVAKETEMEKLKNAFGIKKSSKEGDAFKFESERERQERLVRYAEEERVHRLQRLPYSRNNNNNNNNNK